MKNQSWRLTVLFSEEERKLLQKISAQDNRAEGPEIKWLVRAYAEGRLRPPTMEMTVADMHEKYGREFMLNEKISGISLEVARLRDEIAKLIIHKKHPKDR